MSRAPHELLPDTAANGGPLDQPAAATGNGAWSAGADLPIPPAPLLAAAQGDPDSARFLREGRAAYGALLALLDRHGPGSIGALLDWGCGCGRVLRHFVHDQRREPQADAAASLPPGRSVVSPPRPTELWAADVSATAYQWLRESFPEVSARHISPTPPSELPRQHFDVIYGISVLTHLGPRLQAAWLAELATLLRPAGLLIVTFNGDAALARTRLPLLRRLGLIDQIRRLGGVAALAVHEVAGELIVSQGKDEGSNSFGVVQSAASLAALAPLALVEVLPGHGLFKDQDSAIFRASA